VVPQGSRPKGAGHSFDDIRARTPVYYADLVNDEHPEWRDTSRDEARLRAANAPLRLPNPHQYTTA